MKRHGGFLAIIAALAAAGGSHYGRGWGFKDTRPKEPPDEAARAWKREKLAARGKRRYERWLACGGAE